jgi:hypothetical protein
MIVGQTGVLPETPKLQKQIVSARRSYEDVQRMGSGQAFQLGIV